MDALKLYAESEEFLQFVISIGIPALATIVMLALGVFGGAELVAQVRAVPKRTRKYIDDPTDAVVVTLEGVGELVLKRDLDPKTISEVLVAVHNAFENAPALER